MGPSLVDLKLELKKRTKLSDPALDALEFILGKYNTEPTVESFKSGNVILTDLADSRMLVAEVAVTASCVESRLDLLDFDGAIFIQQHSSVILGWAPKEEMNIREGFFVLNKNALNPMPKSWHFARTCPHIEVYGGFFIREANSWECCNCGKYVQTNIR